MRKIASYKGYDLIHEEFDDDEGFIKNHYEIHLNAVRVTSVRGFTYRGAGVIDAFQDIIDEINA